MAGHKSSSVDKQAVVAKLMKRWKKEFGGMPKRDSLPVLETLVFALCLEDSPYDAAQEAYDKLKASFYDWNEVRVTTISELEPIFSGLEQGEWRAMRIRYLLHYVFDHQYSYDFEALKKKTQELVHKQLAKIKHLTPFSRNFLLQTVLGNHIVPIDGKMCRLAIWLGLLPVGTGAEEGAELLKTTVRKAEGSEFFHLLKSCAVYPKASFLSELNFTDADPADFDLGTAEERIEDLLNGKAARRAHHAIAKAAEAAEAAEAAKLAAKQKAAEKKAVEKPVAVPPKPVKSSVPETTTKPVPSKHSTPASTKHSAPASTKHSTPASTKHSASVPAKQTATVASKQPAPSKKK